LDYEVTVDHKIATEVIKLTAEGVAVVAEQVAKGAIIVGGAISDATASILNATGITTEEFLEASSNGKYQKELYDNMEKKTVKALEQEIKKDNEKTKKENDKVIATKEKELGRKLTEEEKKSLNLKPILDLNSMNPTELGQYLDDKITEYNKTGTSAARKAEIEKAILLTDKFKKDKDDLNMASASVLSNNARYYELGEKINSGKASDAEVKEFWQINLNSMAVAQDLMKDKDYYALSQKVFAGTATADEKAKFSKLNENAVNNKNNSFTIGFENKPTSTTVASVTLDGKTATVNMGHKDQDIVKKNSLAILSTSAHEVTGHVDDIKNPKTTNLGKATTSSYSSYSTTTVPYDQRIAEKSGFYSGASATQSNVTNILNTSKYSNGGWKKNVK
jgi:hypothetical protein